MKEEMDEAKKQIRKNEFIKTNSKVMRTVNGVWGHRWFNASEIIPAFEGDMEKDSLLDTFDYLQEAGYIKAKNIKSGRPVEILYAELDETEIRLTAAGIALLNGAAVDDTVKP